MAANYAAQLIAFINSSAPNSRVRLAMIMGSGLESTWSPATSQPPEKSYGPFQINLRANPGVTEQQAKDIRFSVGYMLPRYLVGVSKVSDDLWRSDPKNAAALAAFYAERPAKMYAQSRVNNVWAAMQSNNYGTGDVSPGSANGSGIDPPIGSSGSIDGTAGGDNQSFLGLPSASDIGDKIFAVTMIALFTLGGVGLVGAGVYRAVQPVRSR